MGGNLETVKRSTELTATGSTVTARETIAILQLLKGAKTNHLKNGTILTRKVSRSSPANHHLNANTIRRPNEIHRRPMTALSRNIDTPRNTIAPVVVAQHQNTDQKTNRLNTV